MKKKNRVIGIIVKPHAKGLSDYLKKCADIFKNYNSEIYLSEKFKGEISGMKSEKESEIYKKAETIVVMGGDGTFLSAATKSAMNNIPVIGINMGFLGFLTEFTKEEFLKFIPSLIEGDYKKSNRALLEVIIKDKRFTALNDVVFSKENLARMSQLNVKVGDRFFSVVRADGLIISTPTGSTAYNLSAGGPIVTPRSKNLLITPICPHSLTLKPVVISSECEIIVEVIKGDEMIVTIDGQRGEAINSGDMVKVRESKTVLSVINNPERDYFSILREKLKWG